METYCKSIFFKELERFFPFSNKTSIISELYNYLEKLNIQNIGYAEVHPAGFICIELIKLESGDSLSLHLWNKPNIESNIHNHSFLGYSWILFGQIKHTVYEIKQHKAGLYNLYKTFYKPIEAERDYKYIAKCNCKKIDSKILKKCTCYNFTKNEFHTITSKSHLSGTLFIRKNRNNDESSCIIPFKEISSRIQEKAVNKVIIKKILRIALKSIKRCKQ